MKCPHCGSTVETRLERRRTRLQQAGLCIDCGKPREKFLRCRDCRVKQGKYRTVAKVRDASLET